MENKNGFDWVAVQLQSQDKTFDDLSALGVSPSETTLQSKEFYKSKGKIKEMFKTKEGAFDQKRFDEFYLQSEKSLNAYKKADTSLGNVTMDLWDDTSMTRALNLNIRRNPIKVSLTSKDPFTNLKIAQGSVFGLADINKWTSPKKSMAEVAQSHFVADGATGKRLNYTPEDTSLKNLFGMFQEPLVMAAYDNDVRDEKGKVIHQKGDYKFDENGLPYYETLAGRDPSGKRLLSRFDTLTKEGSYANKFDFFDSDDIKKSITGTIVKAAVTAAPALIGGPISTAYTAYFIASGLIDGGMEITKSLNGLMGGKNAKNGGLYKWANEMQGYTGQLRGGMTEAGRGDFFSMESILNLAVDSLYQLKAQKAIVQWPLEIKKYQIAKELGVKGDDIMDVAAYAEKYGTGFAQSAVKLSKNIAELEKYKKYASYLSTGYMAATSAVSISHVAEAQGLDARDKGFLYLGFVGALIPLFRSDLGRWVEGRIGGVDDLIKNINGATKDYAEKYFPQLLAEAGAKVGGDTVKAKGISMMATGKALAEKVMGITKLINMDDANKVGVAMLGEGFEEMTEQSLMYSLEGVYNGLASVGIRSTQEDVQFDLTPTSVAKDILMSGVGGALGGAVFHFADSHYTQAFKSDNLMEYITEGYGNEVVKVIKDLKTKGHLGNTSLSATPLADLGGANVEGMWKPVNDTNPLSQNDFIADHLLKTIKVVENLRKAYDIKAPNLTADNKNKFFQNIVDTKTDTDLRDRIHVTANSIYKLALEIQSVENLENESDAGLLQKKAELKILQKELEYLQGDDSLDEFFRQGLFNVRQDISQAFGVKNKESISKEKTGKNYNDLSATQKELVDTEYDNYVKDETSEGLRANLKKAREEYEDFNTKMEKGGNYNKLNDYKESLRGLEDNGYVKGFEMPYTPPGETAPVATGLTYQFTEDYLQKLRTVKYVPDYLFDKIKKDIRELSSIESNEVLGSLTVNTDFFKRNVNNAIKTAFDQPLVKEYVAKLLGESELEDLINSEEFLDIQNNQIPTTNYSTLRILRRLAASHKTVDSLKLQEQLMTVESLLTLDPDQVINALADYQEGLVDDKHPILQAFGKIDGLMDFANSQIALGNTEEMWGEKFFGDTLRNFVYGQQMINSVGQDMTDEQKEVIYTEFKPNIFISLLLDGKYEAGPETLTTDAISALELERLEMAIDSFNNFDKERLTSPLREVMSEVYEFMESEYENLEVVGTSNYLNSAPEFADALDENLKAIDKMAVLLDAAVTVNPLVNDFRKNHKAIIDSTVKDEILFQLEADDQQALAYELKRLRMKIQYLKDINEYNKNNVLQRLLKEDGFELVQKVQSLRDLAENGEVVELVPSLRKIFEIQPINDYFNTYSTAEEGVKSEALHNMAKLEEEIYIDVQKLGKADKIKLVNMTFTGIDTDAADFYEAIDPRKPLTESHRTIYLATLYGSSALDFYSKYSGVYSTETESFTNLENLKHIPFVKQKNSTRLSNLIINGDSDIVEYLYNAYMYNDKDAEAIDFSEKPYDTYVSHDSLVVFGSPGTGKTTAVLSTTLNMTSDEDGNVLLLAPEERQLATLKDSLAEVNASDRVNDKSGTVRSFLSSIGLLKNDKTPYDFESNDAIVNQIDDGGDDADMRNNFRLALESPAITSTGSVGILEDLDIYRSAGKLQPHLFNALSTFRVIVLDEFTHVNPLDVAILTKLIKAYNNTAVVKKDPSRKISLIMLGDENQMGFISNDGVRRDFTTLTNVIKAPPLLTSLRAGWDLINNTLVDITRKTIRLKAIGNAKDGIDVLASSDIIQESRSNPIKLFYTEQPDKTIGVKAVKTKDVKPEDLAFITRNKANIDGTKGKDLVYVVMDKDSVPRAEATLRAAFGAEWQALSKVEIYTPNQVQGGEYGYAIIDASPNLSGADEDGDENGFDIIRSHEFLNTMLSRARHATLILDNGSMDKFLVLQNVEKSKAINQIKITDEVTKQVKDAEQKLMESILRHRADVQQIVKTGRREALYEMPVARISELGPLFKDPKPEKSDIAAKVSNITAYTTFITRNDFEDVYKLVNPGGNVYDFEANKDKVELVINSYKYYLLKKGELGEDIDLAANFRTYFSDYDYNKPKYFLQLSKQKDLNVLDGRSELIPSETKANEVFLLKVSIPGKNGVKPLVLTLGLLNSFDQLRKKYNGKAKLDEADAKVKKFIDSLMTFMADNTRVPDVGTVSNGIWTSKEFTPREWDQLAELWGSRLKFDPNNPHSYTEFKKTYPDLMVTEPQVVVAQLVTDNNRTVLDPDGRNPDWKTAWEDLPGKSIVFVSEYKELQALNPNQLLDIYIKQMGLYGTEEFIKMSKVEKAEYISKVTETVKVGSVNPIKITPGLLKMIRLDNPRDTFLGFRERFLIATRGQKPGDSIERIFEKFDMSPYVKDRLLKSLITIREFLNEDANAKWFTDEILADASIKAVKRVNDVREKALADYGVTVDIENGFDEVIYGPYGAIPSVQDFKLMLDELLYSKERPLLRGKYATKSESSARVNKAILDTEVSDDDLKLKLTPDKHIDFAENILDLNLLNLFRKTKNLNFAEVIDLALQKFSKLPDDAKYDKYRLNKVFKDGMIETVVVAAKPTAPGENIQNVLAPAFQTKQDSTFQFGFGGMQMPAFNIDFSTLLDTMEKVDVPVTQEEAEELATKVVGRLEIFNKMPEDWLESKFSNFKFDHITDPKELTEVLTELDAYIDGISETYAETDFAGGLKEGTNVAYDVTKNGVVFIHTVGSDVRKILTETYKDFKNVPLTEITLEEVSSNNESATFITEVEGQEFKIVYTVKDRDIDLTRLTDKAPENMREKFDSLAGEGGVSGEVLFGAVNNIIDKRTNIQNPELVNLTTVDGIIQEYGRELSKYINAEQVKLLVGDDVDENPRYEDEDMLTYDIGNAFFDIFWDEKEEMLPQLAEMVKNFLEESEAQFADFEATGDRNDFVMDGEDPDFDPDALAEKFAALRDKDGKKAEKMDPMEQLKQDLKDVDDKAKKDFVSKVRELFKEQQNQDPIKEIIKNMEVMFRTAVVTKKLQDSSIITDLAQLGFTDLLIDPMQLTNQNMMLAQQSSQLYRSLRQPFDELDKFITNKIKTC